MAFRKLHMFIFNIPQKSALRFLNSPARGKVIVVGFFIIKFMHISLKYNSFEFFFLNQFYQISRVESLNRAVHDALRNFTTFMYYCAWCAIIIVKLSVL